MTVLARAVAGACILVLSGSACLTIGGRIENTTERTPRPQRTRSDQALLVLGDSITVGARDAGGLVDKLTEDGWIPDVVAEVGKTVPWAIDQVEQRDEVPRVVLVALGTNPSPLLRDFADEVDELLDALRERGARTIAWIPPRAAEPERYAERVSVLRAADDEGRLVLSDWDVLTEGHPEWFHTDGIHLSVDGYRALADHERAFLDRL